MYVVDSRDRFVIKYIDDAIISCFPSRVYNNKNKYLASDTSVEYGKLMSNAINEEINVILNKTYRYPKLLTKTRMDTAENAIVHYAYEQLSPIDILGYSVNIVARIISRID